MRISDWSSDVCSSDLIVASIALGAKFTLIGRAYLYGLMAGGRAGVDRTIQILRTEIERTMTLLGVSSLAELEPKQDRKSVVSGKSVSVRVDLGGRRIINKKNILHNHNQPTQIP